MNNTCAVSVYHTSGHKQRPCVTYGYTSTYTDWIQHSRHFAMVLFVVISAGVGVLPSGVHAQAAFTQATPAWIEPPPNLTHIGPPPKPPWITYDLQCNFTTGTVYVGPNYTTVDVLRPLSTGMSDGSLVLGVLVGVTAVILLVLVAVFIWYKKKFKHKFKVNPEAVYIEEDEDNYLYNYRVIGRKWSDVDGVSSARSGASPRLTLADTHLLDRSPSSSSNDTGYAGESLPRGRLKVTNGGHKVNVMEEVDGSTTSGLGHSQSDVREDQSDGIYSDNKSTSALRDPARSENGVPRRVAGYLTGVSDIGQQTLPILTPIISPTYPYFRNTHIDVRQPVAIDQLPGETWHTGLSPLSKGVQARSPPTLQPIANEEKAERSHRKRRRRHRRKQNDASGGNQDTVAMETMKVGHHTGDPSVFGESHA